MENDSLNKLLKIKALMEQGEGGERENAETFLMRLLDKYNLSLSDLDKQVSKEEYVYSYKSKEEVRVLNQILYTVLGEDYKDRDVFILRKKRCIYASLNPSERAMVEELYTFHKSNFRKEFEKFKESFVSAYINRQDIFPTDVSGEGTPSDRDDEELARIRSLIRNMDSDVFIKNKMIG